MKSTYKNPKNAGAAAARLKLMLTKGYVPLSIAAEMAMSDRTVIHRRIRDNKVRTQKLGKFTFVHVTDLAREFPVALGGNAMETARRLTSRAIES